VPRLAWYRYVKSMRPLQKLRDEEWWAETMTGLRPSLQQTTQQQRRLPSGQLSKASKASLGAIIAQEPHITGCMLGFGELRWLTLGEWRISAACWGAEVKAADR
jgi:hypothetical protein